MGSNAIRCVERIISAYADPFYLGRSYGENMGSPVSEPVAISRMDILGGSQAVNEPFDAAHEVEILGPHGNC